MLGELWDFLLRVFFMGHPPPGPWVCRWGRFGFFWGFAGIFAARGVPLVSAAPPAVYRRCRPLVLVAPASNFAAVAVSVVDAGGGFAAAVDDTGGK